jgi:uncharacterized membrane protein YidH (DUF202 family)
MKDPANEGLASELIRRIVECKEERQLRELWYSISSYIQGKSSTEDSRLLIELFHNQLDLLRYDEFKDRATTDWKRIRAAIEHENTLVNHRLTWLLTSQGFLFAGFALVFTDEKRNTEFSSLVVLTVICVIGIAVSIKTYSDIERAKRQLEALDRWWYVKYAPNTYQRNVMDEWKARNNAIAEMQSLHPTLQGRDQKSFLFDRLLKVESVFICAWLLIIMFATGRPMLNKMMTLDFQAHSYPYEGFCLVFILFAMLVLASWRQAYNGLDKHKKWSERLLKHIRF